MQNRLGNLIRPPSKKLCYHQGFFAVKRRAVFILGSKWIALVRGWRMGLCGWRHGNSFPMTQSAQSHRQMRSIPRCPKAVLYVFVFFESIHDSVTMHTLSSGIFRRTAPTCWGGEIKKRKSGVISFFVVETKGFEPLTSAMWLQRSKPAGLRLYFRLAMQSNKKFGDLATYWRFFLSWRGIFSGFG